MALTNTEKFILFTLGMWYEEANKKLIDKQLEVFISKAVFIEAVIKAGIVGKEERAIYKNLELLEKKKIIDYYGKNLALTRKGYKFFNHIKKELFPYINVVNIISEKDPLTYSKRIQTRFTTK